MKTTKIELPQALIASAANVETNFQTLTAHIGRINDGADEKPWTEDHMATFLQGTTGTQLMELLTKLEFECTTNNDETIYQHPEVTKNATKVPFVGNVGVLAHRSVIAQVARAIKQFTDNQHSTWHTPAASSTDTKPGDITREVDSAMLAPVALA